MSWFPCCTTVLGCTLTALYCSTDKARPIVNITPSGMADDNCTGSTNLNKPWPASYVGEGAPTCGPVPLVGSQWRYNFASTDFTMLKAFSTSFGCQDITSGCLGFTVRYSSNSTNVSVQGQISLIRGAHQEVHEFFATSAPILSPPSCCDLGWTLTWTRQVINSDDFAYSSTGGATLFISVPGST